METTRNSRKTKEEGIWEEDVLRLVGALDGIGTIGGILVLDEGIALAPAPEVLGHVD
jgi:hypothetical protein